MITIYPLLLVWMLGIAFYGGVFLYALIDWLHRRTERRSMSKKTPPFGGSGARYQNALWDAIHRAADEAGEHPYDILALPRASFCAEVGKQLKQILEPGPETAVGCYDCGLPYGSDAWADFVCDHDIWKQISPTGDEGGLLCVNCMNRRMVEKGLEDRFAHFKSGPFAL